MERKTGARQREPASDALVDPDSELAQGDPAEVLDAELSDEKPDLDLDPDDFTSRPRASTIIICVTSR